MRSENRKSFILLMIPRPQLHYIPTSTGDFAANNCFPRIGQAWENGAAECVGSSENDMRIDFPWPPDGLLVRILMVRHVSNTLHVSTA